MKKLQYTLLLLMFAMVLTACKGKQQTQQAPKAQSQLLEKLSADQQKLLLDFKSDPYGCDKKRDAINSSEVAAIFHEHKASMTDVEALIGKAESVDESDGKIVWGYYFDGACQNGKLKPGTVYCLLQLYFDAQTQAWALGSVVCG